MPQLDSLTFFSQFFWFSFFFLGFYILLVKYYLPKMSRLFKVRQFKVGTLQGTLTNSQEQKDVCETRENFLLQGLQSSQHFFQESFHKTSTWVDSVVQSTNQGQFQKMNQTYLSTLGNGFSSQALFFNQLKSLVTPRSFAFWTQDFLPFSSRNRQENLYTFRVFERFSRTGK